MQNDPTAGISDGTGDAYSARVQVDLQDVGLKMPGVVSAYYETRDAGFSTLDYETRVDEELWGVALDVEANERTAYRFYYDSFEDADGRIKMFLQNQLGRFLGHLFDFHTAFGADHQYVALVFFRSADW